MNKISQDIGETVDLGETAVSTEVAGYLVRISVDTPTGLGSIEIGRNAARELAANLRVTTILEASGRAPSIKLHAYEGVGTISATPGSQSGTYWEETAIRVNNTSGKSFKATLVNGDRLMLAQMLETCATRAQQDPEAQ